MTKTAEMKMTSIAPWFGSKRTMAPRIVTELGSHKFYFEGCVGSMAVLLAKEPAHHEACCDLHRSLTNLAWCIQNKKKGLCRCGRKPKDKKKNCEVCLRKEAARRERCYENGVCACGRPKHPESASSCSQCLIKKREYMRRKFGHVPLAESEHGRRKVIV